MIISSRCIIASPASAPFAVCLVYESLAGVCLATVVGEKLWFKYFMTEKIASMWA